MYVIFVAPDNLLAEASTQCDNYQIFLLVFHGWIGVHRLHNTIILTNTTHLGDRMQFSIIIPCFTMCCKWPNKTTNLAIWNPQSPPLLVAETPSPSTKQATRTSCVVFLVIAERDSGLLSQLALHLLRAQMFQAPLLHQERFLLLEPLVLLVSLIFSHHHQGFQTCLFHLPPQILGRLQDLAFLICLLSAAVHLSSPLTSTQQCWVSSCRIYLLFLLID